MNSMRKKHWMDFDELIKEVVKKNKTSNFDMIDFEDQKEIALAWLEHPQLHVRKEAEEFLGETAALCTSDWIGHFAKGEHDKVSESILLSLIRRLEKSKGFGDEMESAYMEEFAAAWEDPAPRKGGKIEEVL